MPSSSTKEVLRPAYSSHENRVDSLVRHEAEATVELGTGSREMLSSWARFPAQYDFVTKVVGPEPRARGSSVRSA